MRDIELFQFQAGGDLYKYYTAETPGLYTSGWEPEAIQRRSIKQSQDASKGEITISVPLGNAVARLLVDDAPQSQITVQIWEADLGDGSNTTTSIDSTITSVWKGSVRTVKKSGDAWELACIAESDRNDGSIPRGRFSSNQCRHALYSRGCGVDKSNPAFHETATVSDTDKDGIQVQVQFDAVQDLETRWVGGMLEGPGSNLAPIVGVSGGGDLQTYTFTLGYWIGGLEVGDAVTAYLGCSHTTSDCAGVFSNISRFGGFPLIPESQDTGLE